MLACFKGTVSAKINSLQQQLQRTDVIPQPSNKRQIQKLNHLESQAWLYEGILERLGSDSSANHEKIARTLEALEHKRSEILQELEPRKPKRYRILARLQDSARTLLASQAERDYEQLQKIVTNVILFVKSRQPSQIIFSEAITKLATEIAESTDKISLYRLRLAYRVDELIRVLSSKLVLNSNMSQSDINYQSTINELQSRTRLLSQEFNNLLRSSQADKSKLSRQAMEISSLTKNMSDLLRGISSRDADIVALQGNIKSLTELAQEKQGQIDSLQNLVRNFRRDVQSSAEFNSEKQNQISQLKSQLSQLIQQKESLQKSIDNFSVYYRSKEVEVENLQNERSHLNSQMLELQRQNQSLHQNYQHQQNVINSLNQQLEELSKANRAKSQKTVATQAKISEAEYQRIINQDEYEYVNGYPNSRSGKWVESYYRRKRRH